MGVLPKRFMYQIFKLIEPQKSMIKSPYLLINIDKRQWNHDLDDQEIEVIEVTGNTVDSSFFNYEELVFGMARGHHFWHQTEWHLHIQMIRLEYR